ncbi:homeobox domain-containing protein [Dichotomocladium elegans]|nr:homeobox domain-containing protein [Dichotomocladium elegans]
MITKNSSIPTRKRTHLKQHQLTVLQNSFAANPLPDGTIRSQLARELGVSERTIQIWFQNRRAKARKMEALSTSLSIGSNCHPLLPRWMERPHVPSRYQPTFRTMMTPKRFEEMRQQNCQQQQQHQESRSSTSTKSTENDERDNDSTSTSTLKDCAELSSAVPESRTVAPVYDKGKGLAVPLSATVLRIGTWTRFAQGETWDLSCDADPLTRQMIWEIQANGHLFRIQVPFDAISQLRLGITELEIDLVDPRMLVFSMQNMDDGKDWIRCGDFSENQQASLKYTHVLTGNHDVFQQALFNLSSLAPELSQKIMYTPPPMEDPCREFTLSPSSTPEPFTLYNTQSMIDKWGIGTAPTQNQHLLTKQKKNTSLIGKVNSSNSTLQQQQQQQKQQQQKHQQSGLES